MATEMIRPQSSPVPGASIQSVNEEIVKAALAQAPESIEKAIRSFEWASTKDSSTIAAKTITDKAAPLPGFVAAPADYFAMAADHKAPAGELVSGDQLLAASRNAGVRKGVQSFLESGIPEALGALKLKLGPKISKPEILEPLNNLLQADQIRNLNASQLQPSMDAVNQMFATLKNVQSVSTHMQVNMMRMIRA